MRRLKLGRRIFFTHTNHVCVDLFKHICDNFSVTTSWAEEMKTFHVTVRTAGRPTEYTTLAKSSADAFDQAAERFSDVPCGITVIAGGR